MLQDRIAKRYAKSIYELAEEKGQIEAVRTDLDNLARLLSSSPELRSFLKLPLISQDRMADILGQVFSKADMSSTTKEYLAKVTQHGRAEVLPVIAREFTELYNEKHNLTQVEIRTAVALSAEQRQHIVAKVEQSLKTKAVVKEQVDPSLIGGLTVRIADRLYDGSVASALKRIDKQFTDNPYLEKI